MAKESPPWEEIWNSWLKDSWKRSSNYGKAARTTDLDIQQRELINWIETQSRRNPSNIGLRNAISENRQSLTDNILEEIPTETKTVLQWKKEGLSDEEIIALSHQGLVFEKGRPVILFKGTF